MRRKTWEVLREVVIHSDDSPDVKAVAKAVGRSPATVYDYLEERRPIPIDLLGRLYVGTGRHRSLLACHLDPIGVGFFDLPEVTDEPLEHLLDLAIRAQEELVDVLREVRTALRDRRIDHAESDCILREISETHTALAVLQTAVKRKTR